MEHFDLLILGSGEAGKYLAWTLSAAGRKTALVERRYIGGSCPNIACLPSKNVVFSAKVAHLASEAGSFGQSCENAGADMKAVYLRKRQMVDGLVETHLERFSQTGVDLILGEGRFVGPRTMEVTSEGQPKRVLTADNIVISTGSRAALDAVEGLADAQPLTHIEALELTYLPKHLIVLGGGYVGLEFAQAMRRLGSRVTVLERSSRLLPREDLDVSEALTEILAGEGVEILTNIEINSVSGRSGERVALCGMRSGLPFELEGTDLLVATGRKPNTEHLQLEKAGVALTSRGFIQVDERLQTTAPGVFAVGDCAGSPHFTHAAFDDFRIVRDALTGGSRVTTGRIIASCLFTDPELARIGLSETEAKARGLPYRLLKLPMKAVLRARTTGRTQGFLKALLADDDRILGFTGFGESAGEMMAAVQLAMTCRLPYTVLRDSIFTHPTYAEGLIFLFSATPTRVG